MSGKVSGEGYTTGNRFVAASPLPVALEPCNGWRRDADAHHVSTTAAIAEPQERSALSMGTLHDKVETALEAVTFEIAPGADRLAEAARYALLAGGKRVRPVLVMATAQAIGLPVEDVLPTACAIEMIHTNSLIVDDLPAMDNHPRRRGRRALHRVYGDDIAILAGCALLSEAQRLILEVQRGSHEVRNLMLRNVLQATGVGGMVSGQFLDVTRYRPRDEQDLERTQMLKTGTLIVASVRCGTLFRREQASNAFSAFARNLGALFQVVDDILDETGKARRLGKVPRNDRRAGKMTNVTMFGLEYARDTAMGLHERCMANLDEIAISTPGSIDALREIVNGVYRRNR